MSWIIWLTLHLIIGWALADACDIDDDDRIDKLVIITAWPLIAVAFILTTIVLLVVGAVYVLYSLLMMILEVLHGLVQ